MATFSRHWRNKQLTQKIIQTGRVFIHSSGAASLMPRLSMHLAFLFTSFRISQVHDQYNFLFSELVEV